MKRPLSLLTRIGATLALALLAFSLFTATVVTYFVLVPVGQRAADDFAALILLSAQTWVELPPSTRPAYEREMLATHRLRIALADSSLQPAARPAAYLRFLSRTRHELMGDPEAGMVLYQKYCQVCHGETGDGDGIMTQLMGIMPMDHTNPNETNSLDNQEIVDSILDGKGRYMPAWRGVLTQADVEALVSYIRLLSH